MYKITNTRYIAYARAHGKSPEEMVEFDRQFYPGGAMAGFITWISLRKRSIQLPAGWKESERSDYAAEYPEKFEALLEQAADQGLCDGCHGNPEDLNK